MLRQRELGGLRTADTPDLPWNRALSEMSVGTSSRCTLWMTGVDDGGVS